MTQDEHDHNVQAAVNLASMLAAAEEALDALELAAWEVISHDPGGAAADTLRQPQRRAWEVLRPFRAQKAAGF